MCGEVKKPKIIEDIQRETDAAIDSVQSQTQAAVNQATGNTSSSSGGKGAPVTTPVFNMPSYGGIGGGFEVPEINIPTPNLDQPIVPPVVNETVNNVVDQVEGINVPRPNTEQDLTKVNTQTVQNAVVDAGSAVQEQVVQSGAAGQQALIDAASATQTNVINTGAILSNNQSNPTLEAAANTVTSNTESLTAEATEYIENKVVPDVRNVFIDFEALTPRIEQTGMMLNPGTTEGTVAAEPAAADLDAKGLTGNEDPFADIETATTKADKMTEEERLRRIRRLMLNRYGREDTILTGAKDPLNRRRYASAL
jgi:hypothetical protein